MNPWLVGFSRVKSYRANTHVKFIRKDLFKVSSFVVVPEKLFVLLSLLLLSWI